MSTYDFVNRLLSEACPHSSWEEEGNRYMYSFYMETHCMGYWVKAELLSTSAPHGLWVIHDMIVSDGTTYPSDWR